MSKKSHVQKPVTFTSLCDKAMAVAPGIPLTPKQQEADEREAAKSLAFIDERFAAIVKANPGVDDDQMKELILRAVMYRDKKLHEEVAASGMRALILAHCPSITLAAQRELLGSLSRPHARSLIAAGVLDLVDNYLREVYPKCKAA